MALSIRQLKIVLATVVCAIGGYYIYQARYCATPDSISYLDIGAAFVRHDWPLAISSYWGLAYPWMLGAVVALFQAKGLQQFAVAHYLNFFILLLDLYLFDRFWSEAVLKLENRDERPTPATAITLAIGYALFLFTVVPLLGLVTPDLLLATVVLAIAICLGRIQTTGKSRAWLAMGFLFGIGYLVKAIMFPLGVLLISIGTVVSRLKRRSLKPPLASAILFLCVSAPLIIALSVRAGHLTTGATGRLNYAWFVSALGGEDAKPQGLLINRRPAVFSVAVRPSVTFSPGFDPEAACGNLRAPVNFKVQALVLSRNVAWYLMQFFRLGYFALLLPVILPAVTATRFSARAILQNSLLLTLPLAGLTAYALVYVELRYLVSFIVVFLGVLLSMVVAYAKTGSAGRAQWGLGIALVLFMTISVPLLLGDLASLNVPWFLEQAQLAETLSANGLVEGDRVTFIGTPAAQFWAKLSNARISAYVPVSSASEFCTPGPEPNQESLQSLRSTGARWLVTSGGVPNCLSKWWTPVPGTSYRFRKL